MYMSKEEIINYIVNNKMLMDAINNVVDNKYVDDFRSHFILQINDVSLDKLNKLIENNELDWYCLGIITNQWDSNTSSFYRIYRNSGLPTSKRQIYLEDLLNINEIIEEKVEVEGKLYDKNLDELKSIIRINLLEQYPNFVENNYHKILFEMYYFEDMTLREITNKTNINKDAISRSIRKTKKWLKNKI